MLVRGSLFKVNCYDHSSHMFVFLSMPSHRVLQTLSPPPLPLPFSRRWGTLSAGPPGRPKITRRSLWAMVDQLCKEGARGYRQRNCVASDRTPSRVKDFRLALAESTLCNAQGGIVRRICRSPPLQPFITLLWGFSL